MVITAGWGSGQAQGGGVIAGPARVGRKSAGKEREDVHVYCVPTLNHLVYAHPPIRKGSVFVCGQSDITWGSWHALTFLDFKQVRVATAFTRVLFLVIVTAS